jgi:transposase
VAVIPERANQIGHRKNRGTAGGRPVGYDIEDYKNRNVVERFFNRMKNWPGLASRCDKHAVVTERASSSPRSSTGSHDS